MERKEEEALRAMIEVTKATNLLKYNDEIHNRPKKEWYNSNKDKEQIKERTKEEIEKERQKAIQKKQKMKEKLKTMKNEEKKEDEFIIKAAKRQIK